MSARPTLMTRRGLVGDALRSACLVVAVLAGLCCAEATARTAATAAPDQAAASEDPARPTSAPDPPEYQEADQPDVHLYQGAYWSLQAHVGLVARMRTKTSESPGPLLGVSARVATLMSLLDVQAHFFAGLYEASTRSGVPVAVGRYSLGLEAKLHPFLTTILSNSTFFYWFAGLYGCGGADLDITTLKARGGSQTTDVNLGWSVGGGSDFPITDPNAGWGLWVGVEYKVKFLGVRSRDLALGPFDEHLFMVTVAYRDNDIFGFRVPRPDEVRHREGDVGHF